MFLSSISLGFHIPIKTFQISSVLLFYREIIYSMVSVSSSIIFILESSFQCLITCKTSIIILLNLLPVVGFHFRDLRAVRRKPCHSLSHQSNPSQRSQFLLKNNLWVKQTKWNLLLFIIVIFFCFYTKSVTRVF